MATCLFFLLGLVTQASAATTAPSRVSSAPAAALVASADTADTAASDDAPSPSGTTSPTPSTTASSGEAPTSATVFTVAVFVLAAVAWGGAMTWLVVVRRRGARSPDS